MSDAPSERMNSLQDNAAPLDPKKIFKTRNLTPAEIKKLKDCLIEGIAVRAIPMGALFGLGGLIGAKTGFLMSSRFGAKPAIIGLGLVGCFMGYSSYSQFCSLKVIPESNKIKIYLTSEEESELIDCLREGKFNRAIPMGVLCGLGGLTGAKLGPLMSNKFGVIPATLGFGYVGYYVGQSSSNKICFDRTVQGYLRKVSQKIAPMEHVDSPEMTDVITEPKPDPGISDSDPKSNSTDNLNTPSDDANLEVEKELKRKYEALGIRIE